MHQYISPTQKKDSSSISFGRNITNTLPSSDLTNFVARSLSPEFFEQRMNISKALASNNEDKTGLRNEIKEHIEALKNMKKELKKQQFMLKTCANECIDPKLPPHARHTTKTLDKRGRLSPLDVDQENLIPTSMITPQNKRNAKSNEKPGKKQVKNLNLNKVYEMRNTHTYDKLSEDTYKVAHTKGSDSYRELQKAKTDKMPQEKEMLYHEIIGKIRRENDSLKQQIETFIDHEKELCDTSKSPSNELQYSSSSKPNTDNPTNRMIENIVPFELEDSSKRSIVFEETPKGEPPSINPPERTFVYDDITERGEVGPAPLENPKRAKPIISELNEANNVRIPLSEDSSFRMDTPNTHETVGAMTSHSRLGEHKSSTPLIDDLSQIKVTTGRPDDNTSVLKMLSKGDSFEAEKSDIRRLREEVESLNEIRKSLLDELKRLKEAEERSRETVESKQREIDSLTERLNELNSKSSFRKHLESPESQRHTEDIISVYQKELKELKDNLEKIEKEKEEIVLHLKTQGESTINHLETQIREKDALIEKLQQTLKENEKELESHKEFVQQEANAQKAIFEQIESGLKSQIEQLQAELSSKQKLLDSSILEIQSFVAKVSSLTNEITHLKIRESELIGFEKQAEEYKLQVAELSKKLEEQSNILKQKEEELIHARNTFEEEITGLRHELDGEKVKAQELNRTLSQKIEELSAKLAETDNERQLIRSSTVELEDTLNSKNKEVELLKAEIEKLNNYIMEFKDELSASHESNKVLLDEKNKLTERVQSLGQALEKLEKENSAKEEEIEILKREQEKHLSEKKTLEEELRKKSADISEVEILKDQITSLEKQLAQTRNEKIAEEKLREKITNEKKAVEKGLSKKHQQIDELQKEIDTQKQENNKLNKDLVSIKEEREKLSEKTETLKKQVRELEERSKALAGIPKLEKEIVEKETLIKELTSKCEELESNLAQATQKLAQKKESKSFSIVNYLIVLILMIGAVGFGSFHCEEVRNITSNLMERANIKF